MPVASSAEANPVIVKRVDSETYENAEITSLETPLANLVFGPGVGKTHYIATGPGVGRSLTGSLLGAYNPHMRTVYVYTSRIPDWKLFSPGLAPYSMTVGSLTAESQRCVESFAALQRDVKRFSKYEFNWDEAGGEPFSPETINSAKEVISQAYEAASKSDQNVIPMLSPCDSRICFAWRGHDKELWAYVEGKLADLYRWHPLGNRDSESFEQIPISKVREHIDWVLS